MHAQLKDICAILSGLMVAQDYKRGQQLLVDRNFSDNATFFQVPMHSMSSGMQCMCSANQRCECA